MVLRQSWRKNQLGLALAERQSVTRGKNPLRLPYDKLTFRQTN
jgi:hypothetical protein